MAIYGTSRSPTAQLTGVFPDNLGKMAVDILTVTCKSTFEFWVIEIIVSKFAIPRVLECLSVG